VVPYTTIKASKEYRSQNIREIVYSANERPEVFSQVRASLDLWGFNTYIDYLYTVCELGFLEGLIPVVSTNFISPTDLKKISEVAALVEIHIESHEDCIHDEFFKRNSEKRIEIRKKNLEWAGKLRIPTITGFVVYHKHHVSKYRDFLEYIKYIHTHYGSIHEVKLLKSVPLPRTKFSSLPSPNHKEILSAFELARTILPEDISITIPYHLDQNIEDFLTLGLKDIGSILTNYPGFSHSEFFDKLNKISNKLNIKFQQRFPLKKSFIKNELYSKKLGQVFDLYKYKIKKESQEKQKELKV
jgi:7,8-didemethyl-8-hydroxy-5-deazariboflavin synthase CofG subunit